MSLQYSTFAAAALAVLIIGAVPTILPPTQYPDRCVKIEENQTTIDNDIYDTEKDWWHAAHVCYKHADGLTRPNGI